MVPSADETLIWEHEWIRSARHLNQWAQVGELAGQLGRPELLMESASMLGEWRALDRLADAYGTDAHPIVPIRGLLHRLQILLHQQAHLILPVAGDEPVAVVDANGAPVPSPTMLQRVNLKQNGVIDRAVDVALQVTWRCWRRVVVR